MIDYLKLVRINNLIFITFTQLIMSEIIIVPILQTFGFENGCNGTYLLLLIASTVLIAAGGYVLNDYFDIKIDAINHPEKQILGKTISRKSAMLLHQILTGSGVLCGLLLAYFAHSYTLVFIFLVVPGLLWFYSASYKRQLIIGNLVVAFLAAIMVLIVGITQLAFLQKEYGLLIYETPIPKYFYGWIGGFALFSFLSTWIREIIKDMEDIEGDKEMECRTMPIMFGMVKTKMITYFLTITTILTLVFFNIYFIPFEGSLTTRYIIWGLILPFSILIFLIFKAKKPVEFHQASTLIKFIMLIGISYGFIFYFLEAKTFGISIFNMFIVK